MCSSDLLSTDNTLDLAPGKYWILFQGYGSGLLNYQLQLVDQGVGSFVTPMGQPLIPGTTIAGTISTPGQQIQYRLSANAGQQFFFDGISGNTINVKIYDPAGYEMFNSSSNYDYGVEELGLQFKADGTYTVVNFYIDSIAAYSIKEELLTRICA